MYIEKKKRLFLKSLFVILVFVTAGWMDPFRDHVSEGNSAFHNKDYPKAMDSYKKAENYAPSKDDEKKLAFNRGDAEYGAENYDRAVMEYKKALESEDPDIQKKAFLNMGNAYLQMKKYSEAADSYMNALKIDPSYAKARNNLEYMLKKRNKEKDRKNDKNDKDNKNDRNKDKGDDKKQDRNKDSKKDRQEQKDQKQQQQKKMSREQVRNILESMKNKPVRRQKGTSNERHNLEKNW